MREATTGGIRCALLAVAIALADAARADINMAGSWDVSAYGSTQEFVFGQGGDNTIGALSNNGLYYWQGTIDVSTGVFSLIASDDAVFLAMGCGTIDATVSPDATTFSGTLGTAPLICQLFPPTTCACGPFEYVPVTAVRTSTSVCGNGSIESGEVCDDGNTQAGDCCSPVCEFESSGTACSSDGSDCTVDACNGAGTCVHNPRPLCYLASQPGQILAKSDGARSRVRVRWKDTSGATNAGSFRDPTSNTDLRVCLFSGSTLVLDAVAPAGSGWSANPRGFVYRAASDAPGGLSRVTLRRTDTGRSLLLAKGRGSTVNFLAAPVAPLRAQILADDVGAPNCWEVQ
jgi:cysteine-rich repeat protein